VTTSRALPVYSNQRGHPVDRLKLQVEKYCRLGFARRGLDDEAPNHGVMPRGLEFLDAFWRTKSFLE